METTAGQGPGRPLPPSHIRLDDRDQEPPRTAGIRRPISTEARREDLLRQLPQPGHPLGGRRWLLKSFCTETPVIGATMKRWETARFTGRGSRFE